MFRLVRRRRVEVLTPLLVRCMRGRIGNTLMMQLLEQCGLPTPPPSRRAVARGSLLRREVRRLRRRARSGRHSRPLHRPRARSRDVWLSIRAFDRKRDSYGFGRREGQDEDDFLRSFLHSVRRRLDVMAASEGSPNVRQVRYEQLVADLAGPATSLSRWLRVDLDPAVVEASRDRFRHHMTSKSPGCSVGRWRTELTAGEARAFDEVLGDHLARLAYAVPDPVSVP